MTNWRLAFDPMSVPELAHRYAYQDDGPIVEIGRRAREAGEYPYEAFLSVCKWKSQRTRSRCQRNTPEEVAEATRISLSANNERLRIGALQCLQGVDLATASVLLHFAHRDPYPILDVRALWSWGFPKPPHYSFTLWQQYVHECRRLAKMLDVEMRVVDRALWQYLKENQGPLG